LQSQHVCTSDRKALCMQSDGQLKRNVDKRLIKSTELGKQKKKKVLVSLVSNVLEGF
jgi:hypothetical protein